MGDQPSSEALHADSSTCFGAAGCARRATVGCGRDCRRRRTERAACLVQRLGDEPRQARHDARFLTTLETADVAIGRIGRRADCLLVADSVEKLEIPATTNFA